MILHFTEPFERDYADLPREIQKRVDKQLRLLLTNLRYPSLQARKWKRDPTGKIWYARVTQDYRFTFEIQGEVFILYRVGKHELIE